MNELDQIANTIANITGSDKELLFRKHYPHTPEAQPIKWMFVSYCYQQGYKMNEIKDYIGFKQPHPLYMYRRKHFKRLSDPDYKADWQELQQTLTAN